jgi:DDE superfamily endonuclease
MTGICRSTSTRRMSIKVEGTAFDGLGYGWSERDRRFRVASGSPRLADKLSFYGLYLYNEGEVRHLYNEGEVRLWPYARRANGEHTIDVLRRPRAEWPDQRMILVWDGAPHHRAGLVREAAAALRIELVPLPGYSPDFMPVGSRPSGAGCGRT